MRKKEKKLNPFISVIFATPISWIRHPSPPVWFLDTSLRIYIIKYKIFAFFNCLLFFFSGHIKESSTTTKTLHICYILRNRYLKIIFFCFLLWDKKPFKNVFFCVLILCSLFYFFYFIAFFYYWQDKWI